MAKKTKSKKPKAKPRTVTTTVTSKTTKKVVQGNPMSDLDTGQEDLLATILLVAENEGDFYPDRPDGAVDKAIRGHKRQAREDLDYDLRVIRPIAVRELRRRWRESMQSNPGGPTEAELVRSLKF